MTTFFSNKGKESKITFYLFQFLKNDHINSNQYLNNPITSRWRNCKNPCAVLNASSSPASITFSNKLVHKSDFALKTPAPGVKFTGENFHTSLGFMKPLSERGTTFQTGRNVVENWEKIKKNRLHRRSFYRELARDPSPLHSFPFHPASAYINEYPDRTWSVNPCKKSVLSSSNIFLIIIPARRYRM